MCYTETILFSEDYWANSQLSIVRHCGHVKINGKRYVIVNKEGKDIFELSAEAEKEGRDKAIEPGEPADLILEQWQPIYKALGRDKFIEYLKNNPGDLKLAKKYIKTLNK